MFVYTGAPNERSPHVRNALLATMLSTACLAFATTSYGHECPALRVIEPLTIGDVPESVTVDRAGNLYYSNLSTIHRRTPDGQDTVFATLPIPVFALGVKVGRDGCVYNTSVSLDPTLDGAFVWKTCTAGSGAQVHATLDPRGGPNDLAFDDDGNLFVTDPFLGQVWKVTPRGQASVWLADPLLQGNATTPFLPFHSQGVNGIAFDDDKRNLYLGVLDYGRIVRVPIRHRGAAGTPSIWVSDARIQGADGIAFDENENLYVAVNGQDQLVRIRRDRRIEVLFQGAPLDGVSSVVFGRGRRDRHTLYVASSAFNRTFGFQPGTPAPALLATTTRDEGLPLP